MQFNLYYSTDVGAPPLDGTTGSLVNVLTACLVNGYGAQSPAGWSMPYTGVSGVAAYRQGSGNMFYLRVDDSGPGAGLSKEARIVGYEFMSSITTGANAFPVANQGVGGNPALIARKSNTNDSTPRQWVVAADSRTFYAFIQTNDRTGCYMGFGFGDFYTLANIDTSNTFIIGRVTENNANLNADTLDTFSIFGSLTSGHFCARTYTNVGTSIALGKHGDGVKGSITRMWGYVPFTNPENNYGYLSAIWVTEPTNYVIRGRMRGLYHFLHNTNAVNDGDTLYGVGPLFVGKTFRVISLSANTGVYVIETSNTLESN